jgi:membrane fusion protein (multidrug efflux system)
LGLVALGWWLAFKRGYVSTDDAYVQGNIVRLNAQVAGTVTAILADATQRVAEGDVLARLDSQDAENALARAWNGLRAAARDVSALYAERDRLQAVILAQERTLDLSRRDLERRGKLFSGNSVTQEELERHQIQVQINEANLQAAQASLLSANRRLGEGPPEEHPAILEAASLVESAWLELSRHEIKSPVAGVVAKRAVQVGSQVSPGTPLLILVDAENVWVDANFKESQLGNIRQGQPARVTVDMYGSSVVYPAVVEGLSPGTGSVFSLLPPENATGNWIKVVQRAPLRVALDPQAIRERPLLLGLSCSVEVNLREGAVSSVPFREKWAFATDAIARDLDPVRLQIQDIVQRDLGAAATVAPAQP